jgi:hypothetical protein
MLLNRRHIHVDKWYGEPYEVRAPLIVAWRSPKYRKMCLVQHWSALSLVSHKSSNSATAFSSLQTEHSLAWQNYHRIQLTRDISTNILTKISNCLHSCNTCFSDWLDFKECRLLGWYVVWLLKEPTFRRTYCSVLRMLLTANVIPSSPILIAQMMQAIRSSETSVLTRATLRNTTEDGILRSHRCQHHESYAVLNAWSL